MHYRALLPINRWERNPEAASPIQAVYRNVFYDRYYHKALLSRLRCMMKKKHYLELIGRNLIFIPGFFMIFLLLGHIDGWSGERASIEMMEGVEIGECKGCHGTQMGRPLDMLTRKTWKSQSAPNVIRKDLPA